MPQNLITVAEYKTYVGINSNTQDDAIALLVPKVSELVKNLCRRTFLDFVDEAKVQSFKTSVNNRILLEETPVLEVSSVEYSTDYGKTFTTLVEFQDYVVDKDLDSIELIASPYLNANRINSFKITYTAGYETLPSDLKLAVLDLVQYYLRNDAALHSKKAVGANSVQIEYITNTALPAHIRRVLDLHTSVYA